MARRDPTRYSFALRYALSLVERMGGPDFAVVPVMPSQGMIDVGARAGKVPKTTALLVYKAMVDSTQ